MKTNGKTVRTSINQETGEAWLFTPSHSWVRLNGDKDTYVVGQDITKSQIDNFISRGLAHATNQTRRADILARTCLLSSRVAYEALRIWNRAGDILTGG